MTVRTVWTLAGLVLTAPVVALLGATDVLGPDRSVRPTVVRIWVEGRLTERR